MIPYELDPTLHSAPPAPPRLDGGFEPPPPGEFAADTAPQQPAVQPSPGQPERCGLNSDKSLF